MSIAFLKKRDYFCGYRCGTITWTNRYGEQTAGIGMTVGTMETMRKPWVYKRKHIKGWWCGWYEGGRRKAGALPNKAMPEQPVPVGPQKSTPAGIA